MKKKIEIVFVLLVVVVLLASCNRKTAKRIDYSIITIRIDSADRNLIGYEDISDGPDISINSILLVEHKAYLLDRYHNNIKVVDLLKDSNQRCEVVTLPNARWVTDLAHFRGNFVISTALDRIIMLDSSWIPKKDLYLTPG
jgi:hypothetical protein